MPTPDGQSLQAPQSPQRREPPTRGSPNPGRWAAPLPGQGGPDCVPSSRARTTGRPKGPQRGGGHVFPEVPPHQCPSACGPQPHPLPPLPGTTSSDPELDDADTARPRAALLEKHPLEGEKQRPGTGQGPFFYIGGTNGAAIISSYCKSKGWQRIQDSRREDYKLKWCEVKCRDTYCSFREGEQLLYQLPNSQLLTTKIGLLSALREHARVLSKTSKLAPCAQAKSGKDTTPAPEELMWSSSGHLGPQSVLKMEDFFPETYRLDIRDEREAFFTLFDALSAETQMWICKPTASNQGKGIFLLRNQEEVAALQAKTQSIEDDPIYRKMPFRAPQARVVQRFCAWAPRGALARYIQNPLLLDGKKFDVRSYLLIACTMPYMVFFGHGYARLTLGLYDPQSSDLCGHLTNQIIHTTQKSLCESTAQWFLVDSQSCRMVTTLIPEHSHLRRKKLVQVRSAMEPSDTSQQMSPVLCQTAHHPFINQPGWLYPSTDPASIPPPRLTQPPIFLTGSLQRGPSVSLSIAARGPY
ncbi:inactive polyglycylase TTLL10 isoform X11 [Sagmatias obliquidens]|uniref:inactive polyglycylase TTLL10 isoform X11 n=1 Tax=Sagmatias obliquidens TaxID=3371155 RepID=UPI000F4464EC|nr:inactive polyglycylase TTLL10 isoform X11 [Lagenorhynchus obliquidens]